MSGDCSGMVVALKGSSDENLAHLSFSKKVAHLVQQNAEDVPIVGISL